MVILQGVAVSHSMYKAKASLETQRICMHKKSNYCWLVHDDLIQIPRQVSDMHVTDHENIAYDYSLYLCSSHLEKIRHLIVMLQYVSQLDVITNIDYLTANFKD